MQRGGAIVFIVGVLLLFFLSAQAIVSVKLLELRVQISRDRLLNYELSSRVLKNRFKQLILENNDDFHQEISRNVLESSIMNRADPRALELNPVEQFGLLVVNAVRLLSLKPFLQLAEDQETLILLRYAFYMERNRRYDVALEKYKELSDRMGASRSDAMGFVMLHQGYCHAIMGQNEEALDLLIEVRDTFAGSHYAETAIVLINLLEEAERRQEEIEEQALTPREKARALFRANQYVAALRAFNELDERNDMDRYMRARSMEETGSISEARDEYVDIVKNGTDREAVRLANRRLLIIGHFYGGGEELTEFAEQQAESIGDDAAVAEIQAAAEKQEDALIVEEIREAAARTGEETALLNDLGSELVTEIELDEPLQRGNLRIPQPAIPAALTAPNAPPAPFDTERRSTIEALGDRKQIGDPQELHPGTPTPAYLYPAGRLVLNLSDGRTFRGREVIFTNAGMQLGTGSIPVQAPYAV
ncbi:MAG: hypothetical protein KDK34_03270, partial [Leptospiraceae bacterium]|nr:hypothetical protein [Leptospiraceae bacterium]